MLKGSKMKINKLIMLLLLVVMVTARASDHPRFPEYSVMINPGPFANKIEFSNLQNHYSNEWKNYIKTEFVKPVNFSGHYRIILSENGILPQECGDDGWVCGWIIDKLTGRVISELPKFNGNTKYFPTIDNGTPSPDLFNMEYYPNSSMIWISGQNTPVNNRYGETKCANIAYNFKDDNFIKLTSSRCEIDVGDDTNAEPYLPY